MTDPAYEYNYRTLSDGRIIQRYLMRKGESEKKLLARLDREGYVFGSNNQLTMKEIPSDHREKANAPDSTVRPTGSTKAKPRRLPMVARKTATRRKQRCL